ncbi:putative oxidoreductase [Rhodococcus opacus B4]|uniref:Putative oxidoreductase n=1 Tax=Rhodococcus opacus (strain B4) TaxID=632772 RepID=C1AX53_RHOOB|nr:putative oxidoreductase [Rhodococcus opacus B4]
MVTGGIVITGRVVVVVVVGASVGATAAGGGTVAVTTGGRVTGVVTGARLIVGGGGAIVVRTGGGGGGAGVVDGAGAGAVVTGAGSVVSVTARGVVRSAICQVGVGGTNTWNVAGAALYGPAACRPSDVSGGGTTAGPRLPNAPPAAPIISPETAETVAIARAPIATVLSSMRYPSSACKCVHHRGRCPRLVHESAGESLGRGSLEGCRGGSGGSAHADANPCPDGGASRRSSGVHTAPTGGNDVSARQVVPPPPAVRTGRGGRRRVGDAVRFVSAIEIVSDVLVLVGGPAATWAALSAAREGASVVLADKGYCGTSGPTASGGNNLERPARPRARTVRAGPLRGRRPAVRTGVDVPGALGDPPPGGRTGRIRVPVSLRRRRPGGPHQPAGARVHAPDAQACAPGRGHHPRPQPRPGTAHHRRRRRGDRRLRGWTGPGPPSARPCGRRNRTTFCR